MSKDICVLGAGASGMVAAICAARRGNKVTIIEHMSKVGKKIYATGNGKCNYTNTVYEYDSYRGEDLRIVDCVLKKFSYVETMDFFEELGVLPKNKNGYIYPYSEQASSIVDVLVMELEKLGVEIRLEEKVTDIEFHNKKYIIVTDKNKYRFTNIIVAMGGKASSKLGSDGSGLAIMQKLGYKMVAPNKALVQLKCRGKSLKSIAGVRIQASIRMFITQKDKKDKEYVNQGEVIFTDYGISGIPIMQLSRYAAKALNEKKKVRILLDFFPDIDYASLLSMIKKRKLNNNRKNEDELLIGMINNKLAKYIFKNILNKNSSNEGILKLKEMVGILKGMELEVIDTNSWDNAQVMAGGISTKNINHETMESKIHKGLYITGEIMDIDGTCGGYNLQWAWATGFIAGNNV